MTPLSRFPRFFDSNFLSLFKKFSSGACPLLSSSCSVHVLLLPLSWNFLSSLSLFSSFFFFLHLVIIIYISVYTFLFRQSSLTLGPHFVNRYIYLSPLFFFLLLSPLSWFRLDNSALMNPRWRRRGTMITTFRVLREWRYFSILCALEHSFPSSSTFFSEILETFQNFPESHEKRYERKILESVQEVKKKSWTLHCVIFRISSSGNQKRIESSRYIYQFKSGNLKAHAVKTRWSPKTYPEHFDPPDSEFVSVVDDLEPKTRYDLLAKDAFSCRLSASLRHFRNKKLDEDDDRRRW